MSYMLYFIYYTMLTVFVVDPTLGETDGNSKGNCNIIFFPRIQFSKLGTAEIYSLLQISLYSPICILCSEA
jgi:hypothetical protein